MTSFLLQKFVKEEADSSKKYGTLIQVLCVVPLIFILIRTLVLKWG